MIRKVKLTPEDKRIFATEVKKLSAPEFVQLTKELEIFKDDLPPRIGNISARTQDGEQSGCCEM